MYYVKMTIIIDIIRKKMRVTIIVDMVIFFYKTILLPVDSVAKPS